MHFWDVSTRPCLRPTRLVLLIALVGLIWLGSPLSLGRAVGQLADIYTEEIQLLGPGSQEIQFADLNGDGWQDAVLSRGNNIYLRFNQNGQFETESSPRPGPLLFIADLDQDGDYDLVVNRSGSGSAGAAVLLNNGTGGFSSQPTLDCGSAQVRCLFSDATVSAQPGDLDNDGDLDLVAGQAGDFLFYQNQGGLSFAPHGSLSVSGAFRLGDMDLDSDPDLVVLHEPNLDVYYNDGSGGFSVSDYMLAYTEPALTNHGSLELGDLDGDGDLDVLFTTNQLMAELDPGGTRLVRNLGNRSFSTTVIGAGNAPALALADLDKDGDLDAVLAGQFYDSYISNVYPSPDQVIFNDGSGNFGNAQPLESGWTITPGVALADTDNDGNIDIALAHEAQTILYLSPAHAGVWASGVIHGEALAGVVLGDMNGDGHLDIIEARSQGGWIMSEGPARIFFNNGKGEFPAAHPYFGNDSVFLDSPRGLAAGDVDGDGDLDLAASPDGTLRLFLNDGGGYMTMSPAATLQGPGANAAIFGDVDGDRDLDLLVENGWYRNDGASGFAGQTYPLGGRGIAACDMDSDGDLDLAAHNGGLVFELQNDGAGHFSAIAVFNAAAISGVACGDLNGDGRQDIAIVADGYPNYVLLNLSEGFQAQVFGPGNDRARDLSLGDLDNDGDLDIAIGAAGEDSPAYYNDGQGNFTVHSVLQAGSYWMHQISLGDLDGDGYLDAVTGSIMSESYNGGLVIDRNRGRGADQGAPRPVLGMPGQVKPAAFLSSGEIQSSQVISIPFALTDPQGDPVSAVKAEYSTNGGGEWHPAFPAPGVGSLLNLVTQTRVSSSPPGSPESSLVLDPAGTDTLNTLAVNLTTASTSTNHLKAALSAPWPSGSQTQVLLFDGDGGVSQGYNGLLLKDSAPASIQSAYGRWQAVTTQAPFYASGLPTSPTLYGKSVYTSIVLPGEYVADLNITVSGVYTGFMRSYMYLSGQFVGTVECTGSGGYSFTLDDESSNNSGLLTSCVLPGTSFDYLNRMQLAENRPASGNWQLTLYLDGSTNMSVDEVRLDMTTYNTLSPLGGVYRPRQVLDTFRGMPLDIPLTLRITDTVTGQPVTPLNWSLTSQGRNYVFPWDTFASGFFGSADDLVFRISATPRQPLPYAGYASSNFPFRARGTQVRVMQNNAPAAGAIVYRIPAGESTGTSIPAGTSDPYQTDNWGFLRGRGQIDPGDSLVAMAPISSTQAYDLYYTNFSPTLTGLTGYVISSPGVQTITVSSAHPLLLLNLDLSLQWDASNDDRYLSQLRYDLQRTSEMLFDWSNGQVTLGRLTIYQNRLHWNDAQIRIYASNRIRPMALKGGIVSSVTADSPGSALFYSPGQVHIGPTWNRYGEPGANLGEDWPRTLAHELGHYALFLDDNYLGLDPDGLLIPVSSCSGAMSDPYRADFPYDEFHQTTDWLPDCQATLSEKTVARSDWQTIAHFYPPLTETLNPGPVALPLDVTQLRFVEPVTPTLTLADPTFYLLDSNGEITFPSADARAFLFQSGWAIDLGHPTLDRILARGAAPGDRLCLYEPSSTRLGCESIAAGEEHLQLYSFPDWKPSLLVTPVTSTTVNLQVTNVPTTGISLSAQLYPWTTSASAPIELTASAGGYSGTFNLEQPAFEGFIQVWVNETEPRREAMTDYTIGGSPGYMRGSGGYMRGSGGYMRGSGAPVSTANGQVTLFVDDKLLDPHEFFTFQSMPNPPAPPAWATLIGQAYRLSASGAGQGLQQASIRFSYMPADVPPGEEAWLKIYFWDGTGWVILPSTLDMYQNSASASSRGPGLYALMSSIAIPLPTSGWNLFSYPVQTERSITEALQSIAGAYTTVYAYYPNDAVDPWRVYDVDAPDWVNDLTSLDFAHAYWISVTQPTTLYLKGGVSGTPTLKADLPLGPAVLPAPPATFYGWLSSVTGSPITVQIAGNPCGQTTVRQLADGGTAFVIKVPADSAVTPGCGMDGRPVLFSLDGQHMAPFPFWENTRPRPLTLFQAIQIFLPAIQSPAPPAWP
jgi:hypothetical protein